VCQKTDVKDRVGLGRETQTVVERVTHSVHRVGEEREHAVEGQVLVDEEEEISPV